MTVSVTPNSSAKAANSLSARSQAAHPARVSSVSDVICQFCHRVPRVFAALSRVERHSHAAHRKGG
ncbi:Uncharacterised protein [Mycobacteroides abscessus subsp. abscessus]|nr:Uncharacterised protein [Mycobacteroides abscessus subsp. abscessus]